MCGRSFVSIEHCEEGNLPLLEAAGTSTPGKVAFRLRPDNGPLEGNERYFGLTRR